MSNVLFTIICSFFIVKILAFFGGHLEIFKQFTVTKLGHEVASCLKKLILFCYLGQLENLTPTPADKAMYLKTLACTSNAS